MGREWMREEWLPVTTPCPECGGSDVLKARWGFVMVNPDTKQGHEGWWLKCQEPKCGWQGEGNHAR